MTNNEGPNGAAFRCGAVFKRVPRWCHHRCMCAPFDRLELSWKNMRTESSTSTRTQPTKYVHGKEPWPSNTTTEKQNDRRNRNTAKPMAKENRENREHRRSELYVESNIKELR